MQDTYSNLLKQAQDLVAGNTDSDCALYVQYLTDLRADGKPFNEKETAFLVAFTSKSENYACPKPPSKWRYVAAGGVVAIPLILAVLINAQPHRRTL